MSAPALALWEAIRIPPIKWRLSPWGNKGGGFWVVGILGRRVIWFNDIEDGFNVSHYDSPGVIAEYLCDQDELHHTVCRLMELLQTGIECPHCGPPQPVPTD
jgi:hypothetical protein